jgi:hypothetical protein
LESPAWPPNPRAAVQVPSCLELSSFTVLGQWIRQGANQYLEITLRQAARLEKALQLPRRSRSAGSKRAALCKTLRCVAKEQFAQIVKDYAERVGLDPALYAGHSMCA